MSIPKHEPNKPKGAKKTRLTLADMPHIAGSSFVDMTSVAEAIEGFARIFSTYVTQARDGDNSGSLYTTPTGYPVKVALTSLDGDDDGVVTLVLEGDAVDSIAYSLKRIADAMSAKQA